MDELKNVTAELIAEKDKLISEYPQDILDIIKASTLDMSKDNPDPQPLIMLDGCPMCTRGNFSYIIGLPGSRKSFLCTAIAGAFMCENGFMGMENANGSGKLLWIDTEQAPGHVARIGRRLNRIVGLQEKENPTNITILMLRPYSPAKRYETIKVAIDMIKPDFIVIDGLADLITDPNNPEQSSEVTTYLMEITQFNNCHILTVVHANIGSEKARGHLGSECHRKCETAMSIRADGLFSKIAFTKSRDFMPNEYAFTIVDGLPVLADVPKNNADVGALQEIMAIVMPDYPTTIQYKELTTKIMEKGNVKESMAKKRIKQAAENGIIIKNHFGRYHLPQAKASDDNELPF